MASRLVLVLGDLFIPDRAPVRAILIQRRDTYKANGIIGYSSKGLLPFYAPL